jgi:hypothetical protein
LKFSLLDEGHPNGILLELWQHLLGFKTQPDDVSCKSLAVLGSEQTRPKTQNNSRMLLAVFSGWQTPFDSRNAHKTKSQSDRNGASIADVTLRAKKRGTKYSKGVNLRGAASETSHCE